MLIFKNYNSVSLNFGTQHTNINKGKKGIKENESKSKAYNYFINNINYPFLLMKMRIQFGIIFSFEAHTRVMRRALTPNI